MYFTVLLVIVGCTFAQNVPRSVMEMAEEADNNKVIQQVLRELITSNTQRSNNFLNKTPKLMKFSWSNCGGPSDLVVVSSLSLQPDPLVFPGPLNISAVGTVTGDINDPLTASLEVKKEEFGIFIKVPCIEGVGSCTYKTLCQKLETLKDQCPAELKKYGLDCKCPIRKKHYSVKNASFQINLEDIPGGKYEVRAQLTQGAESAVKVMCLDLKFTIK